MLNFKGCLAAELRNRIGDDSICFLYSYMMMVNNVLLVKLLLSLELCGDVFTIGQAHLEKLWPSDKIQPKCPSFPRQRHRYTKGRALRQVPSVLAGNLVIYFVIQKLYVFTHIKLLLCYREDPIRGESVVVEGEENVLSLFCNVSLNDTG